MEQNNDSRQLLENWENILYLENGDPQATSLPADKLRGSRLKKALESIGLEKSVAAANFFNVSEKTLGRWLSGSAMDAKKAVDLAIKIDNDILVRGIFIAPQPTIKNEQHAWGFGVSSSGQALIDAYRKITDAKLRVAICNRVFNVPCLSPHKHLFLNQVLNNQVINREESALLSRLESLPVATSAALVGGILNELRGD